MNLEKYEAEETCKKPLEILIDKIYGHIYWIDNGDGWKVI